MPHSNGYRISYVIIATEDTYSPVYSWHDDADGNDGVDAGICIC
jgi:hypothetical protein